jgi:hypothetical protein
VKRVGTELQIYDDPEPHHPGLSWVFEYEGTFARARAKAQATPFRLHALARGIGTSAGLAIGNVAYYYTSWPSTPQRSATAQCLVSTYQGQPRWPASVDPTSLAVWPGDLYRR